MATATSAVPHAPGAVAAGAPVDPQTLPDHSGQRRAYAVEFFAPPAPQIGDVRSADATLKQGKRPKSLVVRLAIGALVAGLIIGAFHWATSFIERRGDAEMVLYVGYGLAALALVIHMWVTRFKATCTYVGERGVVRYTLKGSPERAPAVELLLFD